MLIEVRFYKRGAGWARLGPRARRTRRRVGSANDMPSHGERCVTRSRSSVVQWGLWVAAIAGMVWLAGHSTVSQHQTGRGFQRISGVYHNWSPSFASLTTLRPI